jgi:hypothetical protein
VAPSVVAATRRQVFRAQRRLLALYRLEVAPRAWRFLLSPDEARALLPEGAPRTGLLALEEDGELWIGLYVDPRDLADPDTVVEETSHFVCLAWHAEQGRPVSALTLELQSEIDRYLLARLDGRDPLAHFRAFEFEAWMDPATRERYEVAHAAGHRYCRALDDRFPHPHDLPELLDELRGFYRAPAAAKLHRATAAPA